ncbi:ras-related protein Rab-44 isoform X2 [Ochotona curzoniae]|uniref:ras-related protein Rab-44 isoform X2 n=1 Tax=Ochotona curzoniae TaxID=130825 RepID=UPI001B347BE8|nr:ras-related protein Rab-44 isoform X2 [Ochotona curzoniae]
MESGQRTSRKSRKLGSSRRQQMREPADGQDAPMAQEPVSWSSQAQEELQAFLQDCGAKDRRFVTRQDLEAAKFSFLGSNEELEMIFDWVDVERKGRLSLEEFNTGLKSIFGSSLSTHRLRRRRPRPTKRVPTANSFLELEEANAEEREAFLAFVEQLGTSPFLPEQVEIWQLWRRLRQEEPQLAGNLEGFLARMNSRLQEAQANKEALEQTLRKRDSDHHQEVRRLYEEMEQQIAQDRQQLQAESDSRGLALSSQVQDELMAKECEAQRLAASHRELEAQLQHLSSSQQEAHAENLQLREAERELAGRLEEVQGQLQVTKGHLATARARVSWQTEEEPRVLSAKEKALLTPEEAPLPEILGDNDNDWAELLSRFCSPSHGALQLTWSPPPTPRATLDSPPPRVVRQISISESCTLPLAQKPVAGPDEDHRNTPGMPAGAEGKDGVELEGQDVGPELPAKLHILEPRFQPESPAEEAHLPSGESRSPVVSAFKARVPLEEEPPPQAGLPSPQALVGPSKQIQASDPHDQAPGLTSAAARLPKQGAAPAQDLQAIGFEPNPASQNLGEEVRKEGEDIKRGGVLSSMQSLEASGPPAGPWEQLPHGALQASLPVLADTESPDPGKLPPARGPPPSAPLGAMHTFSYMPELGARPSPPATAAHQEPWPGSSPSKEPRAESHPAEPGMDSESTGQNPSPGTPWPGEPQLHPDCVFHIIFLGDSNVGKTSFLHLLHHNSFAVNLSATVGVDFRVKTLLVDNKCFALQLWDTAGQERYFSLSRQLLRKADGAVLMYDVTSHSSFTHIRYWLDCLQELGVSFEECSAALGHNILEPMVSLVRSLKMQEDRLKQTMVDMISRKPPKRAGCCS